MANPKLEVLTPQNSQLIFIDHQPQMAFGVQSIDRQVLKNNVVALAKAAKVFKIPTTITTGETQGFSRYTSPALPDVFPAAKLLERTSMNSVGRQEGARCPESERPQQGRRVRVVDRGLQRTFALSTTRSWNTTPASR